jgi:predicted fused transcriptional regulator/phosphomethylpyrimidine kinase
MENRKARRAALDAIAAPEDLLDRFLSLPSKRRDEEFWSVKAVANLLNKHASTIRQRADEGKIPHIKIFGTIYVHVPSLLNMLKTQTAQ